MSTQPTSLVPSTYRPAPRPFTRRLRRFAREADLGKNLALIILGVLTLYPLAMMVILSGKDTSQFTHDEFGLDFPFHLDNYSAVWDTIRPNMVNSAIVSLSSCAGVLLLSCVGGFVFARYNFPGKTFLWYAILSLLMIPFILTLIHSFFLVKQLHLLDTLWAVILPYIAGGQVFGMLLLRSFFASLPEEMFEAARIDGAGDFVLLVRLAVPLSAGILGTLAILNILYTWNDLIWPSVVLQDDSVKTLTLGLWSFRNNYFAADNWGPMMAGYTIASIPLIILFVFTSRLFVKGLSSGAIKM